MPPDETITRRRARGSIHGLFGRGELPPAEFSFFFRQGALADAFQNDEWAVRGFTLSESVGAPYRAEIDLLAPTGAWDAEALLGTRVELQIARGPLLRSVLGVVLTAHYLGAVAEGHHVRLTVGPAISVLGETTRSRVFQDTTIVEIVREVVEPALTRYGGAVDVRELTRSYPPRDYCVQYRESDLAFAMRVLADAGVTLLFRHDGDAETMVLIDSNGGLPMAGVDPQAENDDDEPPMIPRWHGDPETITVESIAKAHQSSQPGRSAWTAVAWDWKAQPPTRLRTSLQRSGVDASVGERIDVGTRRPDEGAHSDGAIADTTQARASLLADQDLGRVTLLESTSNATALRAGSVFELADQHRDHFGEQWAVTAVEHRGDAPHVGLRGAQATSRSTFTNAMRCQPRSAALRPQERSRPTAMGATTAIVTGPPGEAIHTDAFGRVRVRFLWDDESHEGEHTSCWLRVVRPWAGDGYGSTFIPRVGAEVLVTFIDGDPDRPVCSGSLHNGRAMPTYPLPEHRTRTVLRTQHVGGDGEGFHELWFEDGAGVEEVHLHSGGKLTEKVCRSHSTSVNGARSLTVGGKRSTTIRKDDESTIEGQQRCTVDNNVFLQYRSGVDVHVSESPAEDGDDGFRTYVRKGLYEVEVTDGIEFRCGDCVFRMTPDTITLEGPRIIAKTTGEAHREKATLFLADATAELRADEVHIDSGAALATFDERLRLNQGPRGASKATVVLDDGAATISATTSATVEGETVLASAKGEATVCGGGITLTSQGSLNATTIGDLTVAAKTDLVLSGAMVRIN